MSPQARAICEDAVACIHEGKYSLAVDCLRFALRNGVADRRAWSKLMLAIRELNRLLPAA